MKDYSEQKRKKIKKKFEVIMNTGTYGFSSDFTLGKVAKKVTSKLAEKNKHIIFQLRENRKNGKTYGPYIGRIKDGKTFVKLNKMKGGFIEKIYSQKSPQQEWKNKQLAKTKVAQEAKNSQRIALEKESASVKSLSAAEQAEKNAFIAVKAASNAVGKAANAKDVVREKEFKNASNKVNKNRQAYKTAFNEYEKAAKEAENSQRIALEKESAAVKSLSVAEQAQRNAITASQQAANAVRKAANAKDTVIESINSNVKKKFLEDELLTYINSSAQVISDNKSELEILGKNTKVTQLSPTIQKKPFSDRPINNTKVTQLSPTIQQQFSTQPQNNQKPYLKIIPITNQLLRNNNQLSYNILQIYQISILPRSNNPIK
jgi:hypothetical protein